VVLDMVNQNVPTDIMFLVLEVLAQQGMQNTVLGASFQSKQFVVL